MGVVADVLFAVAVVAVAAGAVPELHLGVGHIGLAADGVRIEAPIPGKSAIGIEVPNKSRRVIAFREILDTKDYRKSTSKLNAGLGKDISGNCIACDIAKLPHMLIAGTTGSGKSVCINSIIASILYKARPDEVKLIMIDPKQVEFTMYNGIPHLLVPVVTDVKQELRKCSALKIMYSARKPAE